MNEKEAIQCGDGNTLAGREPLQMGWYEFASTIVSGKTVLDVGCGSGEGLKLLTAKAKKAVGIDLDNRLIRPDVEIQIKDISEVPDNAFDIVICIDVIEHVKHDRAFAQQLARVAREKLFVSTPNFSAGRNIHPFHYREYTPTEFESLFSGFGKCEIFGGTCTGESRKQITNKTLYYFLNILYSCKATELLGKIVKRLLFVRIWPHQAAIVTISNSA